MGDTLLSCKGVADNIEGTNRKVKEGGEMGAKA